MSTTEQPLFFIDTVGDATALDTQPSQEPDLPTLKSTAPGYVPLNQDPAVKKDKNNKSRNKAKGKKKGKKSQRFQDGPNIMRSDDDMDAMIDYLKNSDYSHSELRSIQVGKLAELSLDDYLSSPNGDEGGYYDRLMQKYDDQIIPPSETDDSDEDLNDSFNIDAQLDDELSSDGELDMKAFMDSITDNPDDYDDTKYFQAEFENENSEDLLTESDENFDDADLQAISFQHHSKPASMVPDGTLSKSQARKAAKRAKKEQKAKKQREKDVRDAQSAKLNQALYKSPKIITKEVEKFLININRTIKSFLEQSYVDQIPLPCMPSSIRFLVRMMADHYHVVSKTHSGKSKKSMMIFRRQDSQVPENWELIPKLVITTREGRLSGSIPPRKKKDKSTKSSKKQSKGSSNALGVPKMGDVVGANAPPVSEDNKGHKMLLAMGWKPGQSLGTEGAGIIQPVSVTVRSRRGGLGTE